MSEPNSRTDDVAVSPGGDPDTNIGAYRLRTALMLAALVLFTWWVGWWGLAIFGGLVLMIFLHEFGHFIMAKRAGMKVTEFFICFGPKLWSFRRGETEYGIKLVPLGAYVKIVGMSMIEEVDEADLARTYRAKPFWQRFGVAVAGSTMHFLQALVLIFVLLVWVGVPGGTMAQTSQKDQVTQIGGVFAHCPAAKAGLKPEDEVLSINGQRLVHSTDLGDIISPLAGEDATFKIRRAGEEKTLVAHIVGRTNAPDAQGLLGVTYGQKSPSPERVGVLEAVPRTVQSFGSLMWQTIPAFVRAFSPSSLRSFGSQVVNAKQDRKLSATTVPAHTPTTVLASSTPVPTQSVSAKRCIASMGGPPALSSDKVDTGSTKADSRFLSIIGIFDIGKGLAESGGIAALLSLFVIVNIFIGIFNLIPLPPFDGGHVAIAVYEKFQEWRKGLTHRYYSDANKLLPITSVVILLLGLLFVSTIYLDLVNPPSVN